MEYMDWHWIVTTDRLGRRTYTNRHGYIIDGHGYGRMRWTVWYTPEDDSDNYGMTDSLGEAQAWAVIDYSEKVDA